MCVSIHVRIKAAVVIHTNGQLWCFLYRYTHTAASGEETQTGHVSICIVQYRETSIQPHVLNTEHMKAPSMQADTLPIPDHAPTKYIAIQDVGTLKYNGCISDKIHRRYSQKRSEYMIWGGIVPIFGGNSTLTLLPRQGWTGLVVAVPHVIT